MALTLNDFIGFETGGLEEATSTGGSPDATEATVVRSGARSLGMNASTDLYRFNPLAYVSSGGTGNVVGFGFYTTDITPAVNAIICSADDSVETILFSIQLQTNGDLIVKDHQPITTVLQLFDPPFAENTWHYVEFYWEHSSSAAGELFIDGVSMGTISGANFSGGGTLNNATLSGPPTVSGTWYFDDVYWLTGAGSGADHLGNAEAYKYQSSKASATPDTGSDLDAGDWDECGKTPLDTTTPNAEYTDTGAGSVDSNATDGSPEGPKNDPRITGEIIGMKGISNMKRSGGGGTDHFILMGNDVDGTTRSADLDPPTTFANYFFLSESDSIVPNVNEYCSIGFEMTNAQDYECQEQWAMILHVPATIAELGIRPPLHERILRHHLVR